MTDAERKQRIHTGRRGEAEAVACVEARGYAVVQRNWRLAGGEADVIGVRLAPDGQREGVLVEVKASRTNRGGLGERLGPAQGKRLWKMAAQAAEWLELEKMEVALVLVVVGDDGVRVRWVGLEAF
ncbi:MAG: hypothetical protein EXR79_03570 [Myxococcales bacterium]|nr:hypothetical protein [Myxococcales bacterium]